MIPLRVLIIEDSEADAELLLHDLRHGGYAPAYERVETPDGLSDALSRQSWDLIISDYAMPCFNGLQALKLVQEKGYDIPFIIVSGSIGEDVAVEAMRAGAHDYLMKGHTARLLPAIARELREVDMRQGRRQADETIHRLAYTDPVTNLPNRIRFRELVQNAIETGQREQRPIALLLMDLDRFKEVNDTLGHRRGDNLLQQVGLRLRSALFAPDVVARLGGDEFGILLPRLAATGDVEHVIKKLHKCLEAPFMVDGIQIAVETSIGVATMPEHANDADTLLQRADIAMYRAKKMASDYAVYAPEFNPHSPERLGLMAELRDAIEQNQLVLHFQPKVNLKTGRIIGNEALVRWQHPRLGLLFPDKFILAAEQTGSIGPLTRWVLIDALTHCQGARCEGIRLRMSVNLSARSLHDPQLLKMIADTIQATGAEPGQLMLEITESAIVLDPKRAEENLSALSRMGIYLSIDDFGTGYTSLASIKRLPINEIKIDRSFVTNMLTDKNDAMIVRTIIELGHNFGLTVVAEGVETKEVQDALVTLGCDEVQGYFISKPQSCELLKKWFSTSPYKVGPTDELC
ncbi:MAG: EAL domain-containing protein [Gallionella sp.]|nr:EAL domain-containing protein [Gallionella sp.]